MVTETSFADRDGAIWMNGEMIEWRDAKVHVLTHTLHYGVGVFEGVRAYDTLSGPSIFRLQDHTRRLFDSAQILRLDIPFSESELNTPFKKGVVIGNRTGPGPTKNLSPVAMRKLVAKSA